MFQLFRAASETGGTPQHQLNTGINRFYTPFYNHSSFGNSTKEDAWNCIVEGCLSDTFAVFVDKEILFSLILTIDCEFLLLDYQSHEQIYGGYSISDKIIKGSVSTIDFFIEDEPIGEATIAWPLEDDLCLIINGVVFRKMNKTKN